MKTLLVIAVAALSTECASLPKNCAKYGTLDAEYAGALQKVCGKLDDRECQERYPAEVAQVDAEFSPRFQEAERCQAP